MYKKLKKGIKKEVKELILLLPPIIIKKVSKQKIMPTI